MRQRIASLLICLGLSACGSTPATHFYVLDSLAPPSATTLATRTGPSIGISTVSLPAYLDRLPIVRRDAHHELQLDEFQRWAEPLGEAVPRVLAANLSTLLENSRIVGQPWDHRNQPQWKVLLQISELQAVDGQVQLQARWQVAGSDGVVILNREGRFRIALADNAPGSIAAAHSQALAELSRALSDDLRPLVATPAP